MSDLKRTHMRGEALNDTGCLFDVMSVQSTDNFSDHFLFPAKMIRLMEGAGMPKFTRLYKFVDSHRTKWQ